MAETNPNCFYSVHPNQVRPKQVYLLQVYLKKVYLKQVYPIQVYLLNVRRPARSSGFGGLFRFRMATLWGSNWF
jgi:hypothetical protein